MSIAIAAAAVFLFSGLSETPKVSQVIASEDGSVQADPQALGRAEEFIAKIDDGDWESSWATAGDLFQSEVTEAEWAERISSVREPLGAVLSRRLANEQFVTAMPGGSEGEFRVLQFHTRYEGRPGNSIETIVMMRGSEGWEITGYFIA